MFELTELLDPSYKLMVKILLSLFIGALIGVEREFQKSERGSVYFAGIRTFPFICLFGFLSALLSSTNIPWFFPITFLAFTIHVTVSHFQIEKEGSITSTTPIASFLVFLMGAMVYWDYVLTAIVIGVLITFILYLKEMLHNIAKRLDPDDIHATLKFALITIVVLPFLPNKAYGMFNVLNPFQIWVFVVLIMGISFTGYIVTKLIDTKNGIGLTGLVGGVISSTAVTLSFAQRSKESQKLSKPLGSGIIISMTAIFPRLFILISILNYRLALEILPIFSFLTGIGLVMSLFYLLSHGGDVREEDIEFSNPFQLTAAMKFGVLFAFVLLITKGAQHYFGSEGLYIASFLGGVVKTDAVVLSLIKIVENTFIYSQASLALISALFGCLMVNIGIVYLTGSSDLKRRVTPAFVVFLVVNAICSMFYLI